MKRDMKAIIATTEKTIPTGYQLNFSEAIQLKTETGITEAIANAFTYGFALGRRAEKNAKKKPLPKR